jgi:hypothetical protein
MFIDKLALSIRVASLLYNAIATSLFCSEGESYMPDRLRSVQYLGSWLQASFFLSDKQLWPFPSTIWTRRVRASPAVCSV